MPTHQKSFNLGLEDQGIVCKYRLHHDDGGNATKHFIAFRKLSCVRVRSRTYIIDQPYNVEEMQSYMLL